MDINYQYVLAAVVFGFGYLSLATLIGLCAVGFLRRRIEAHLPVDFWLCAPLLGILIHISLSGLVYLADKNSTGFVLWGLVGAMFFCPTRTLDNLKRSGALLWPLLSCAAYALICFSMLVAYHYGPAKGNDWFSTIYRLTVVSPGDSPQSMFQAQYLLHGKMLVGAESFALFDRPFLGGFITLFSLSSFGLTPSAVFYENTELISLSYLYLWASLNSLFCLTLFALARRFKLNGRSGILFFVVLASPFVVFNVVAAWPKLLSTYILICAFLFALDGRRAIGVLLSGIAFLSHGSFLWAHIAFACVLMLLCVVEGAGGAKKRTLNFARLFALSISFPAVWFIAEKMSGNASPLRSYYLYDVSSNYGLTHAVAEMAENFYKSTTPGNLALLPFVNLIKGLLPFELVKFIASYSYSQTGFWIGTQRIMDAVSGVHLNRPLFSFGFFGFLLVLRGFRSQVNTGYVFGLALVSFFILPLVPGMALYRRDDHFVTAVMMFTLIPLVIALIGGIKRAGLLFCTCVLFLVLIEYGTVFLSRYPVIRYGNEFFEFYPSLVCFGIISCWSVCLYYFFCSEGVALSHFYKFDWRQMSGAQGGGVWGLILIAVCALLVAGVLGPAVVPIVFDGSIHKKYSQKIHLLDWRNVEGVRNGQPFINMKISTADSSQVAWINSGQSLIFKSVPIGEDANFVGQARLHEGWESARLIPNLRLTIAVYNDNGEINKTIEVGDSRDFAEKWRDVKIDLSEFSGQLVDVKVGVEGSEAGVWMLWKGLGITSDDSLNDVRLQVRLLEKNEQGALRQFECDRDPDDARGDIGRMCSFLRRASR